MTLTLPKLSPKARFTNSDGTPTQEFRRWYDELTSAVEAHETTQDSQIEELARAIRSLSFPAGAAVAATDAGSDATATITAHVRTYMETAVPVDGGSITGLAYGARHFIYYDDPDDAGGAVTYAATTTQADALTSTDNPNRHFVGTVTTPGSGGAPTTGNPSVGAGGVEVQ